MVIKFLSNQVTYWCDLYDLHPQHPLAAVVVAVQCVPGICLPYW